MLDARQRKVLLFIVEHYVQTAEPVGSRVLSKSLDLNVSAATIRNIMADLTEMGLIAQPHTSAGRIPTDKGYRYYVNGDLSSIDPTGKEEGDEENQALSKQILKHYNHSFFSLDEILQNTAALLAGLTNLTGIVAPPKPSRSKMKRVELLSLNEQQILVVLVTNSGMVMNKIIASREGLTQEFLNQMNNFFNEQFTGCTLAEVREKLVDSLTQEQEQYRDLLPHAIRLGKKAFDIEGSGELYIHGQSNMFLCPEFSDPEMLQSVYQTIEEKTSILRVLNLDLDTKEVKVRIGLENRCQELDHCTIVSASYGTIENLIGSIGVIGPTRMDYHKVASVINYTARSLSQTVNQLLE